MSSYAQIQEWAAQLTDTQGSAASGANVADAHTPDGRKYHSAKVDEKLAAQVGYRAVVVPRANAAGMSSAFNHNIADVVVIDPDDGGNGLTVDLSKLKKGKVAEVMQTMDLGNASMQEVFRQLQAHTQTSEPNKIVPTVPAPVVPTAKTAAQQSAPIAVPMYSAATVAPSSIYDDPEVAMAVQQVLERKKAQAVQAVQATPVVPASQYNSGFQEYLQELKQQQAAVLNAVDSRIAGLENNITALSAWAKAASESINRIAVSREINGPAHEEPYSAMVDVPVETVPERTEAVLASPEYEVSFGLANGNFRVYYHNVIVTDAVVALVYDRRWRNSPQFVPRQGEQVFTVQVASPNKKNATYRVVAMGLDFSMDDNDIIVLVRSEEEYGEKRSDY